MDTFGIRRSLIHIILEREPPQMMCEMENLGIHRSHRGLRMERVIEFDST